MPAVFNADALDDGTRHFLTSLGRAHAWEHMKREFVDAVRLVANVLVAGEASREGDDHTDWVAEVLEPIGNDDSPTEANEKYHVSTEIEMKALRQDDACIF